MTTVRVAMLADGSSDIFARGVIACLREDPMIELLDPAEGSPDVAIVDPEAVVRCGLTCPLIVCVAGPEPVWGADGPSNVVAVMSKLSVTPEQLVSAIRAAAAGLRLDTGKPEIDLDDRSVRVLQLLSDGAATAEIAAELGYSERTIKSVIYDVERELGAKNRAHAVATAVRRNLI